MPELRRVLADYDLALLRLIASLWGTELLSGSQREAVDELAAHLLQPDLLVEVTSALPPEAGAGLMALARGGRQPLAQFTRRYGELRAMGPARRERERPWERAPSPSEALWYRGLVGRAFFDDGRGLEEFVFIPNDLRSLLTVGGADPLPGGPPGHSSEAPSPWASSGEAATDDVVTLLAYLQVTSVRLEQNRLPDGHVELLGRYLRQPDALELYLPLIADLGLITAPGAGPLKLDPERAQPFLQAPRAWRVRWLASAWRESRAWNDLLRLPGLAFEGNAWHNDPTAARDALLALLGGVPAGTGWSVDSFVAAVKERQPDYQRPAGDYDSWYIRDATTQTYLRGFENWERIDGALVRWLLHGPLFWLGLVDRAPGSFRLTPYGAAHVGQSGWDEPDVSPPPLTLSADGTIHAHAAGSGYDRFQLARISDWKPLESEAYVYRLTPAALSRAGRKGIGLERILAFLEKAAGGAQPRQTAPDFTLLSAALRRWEKNGGEAALREAVVLKLSSAELLETLRRAPSVREYLGEGLGPAAVAVRREHVGALRAALATLGILADAD